MESDPFLGQNWTFCDWKNSSEILQDSFKFNTRTHGGSNEQMRKEDLGVLSQTTGWTSPLSFHFLGVYLIFQTVASHEDSSCSGKSGILLICSGAWTWNFNLEMKLHAIHTSGELCCDANDAFVVPLWSFCSPTYLESIPPWRMPQIRILIVWEFGIQKQSFFSCRTVEAAF